MAVIPLATIHIRGQIEAVVEGHASQLKRPLVVKSRFDRLVSMTGECGTCLKVIRFVILTSLALFVHK